MMGSDERPDATVLAQSICVIMEQVSAYEAMTARGEQSLNLRMDCLRLFATIHEQGRVLLEHSAITDFPEVLHGLNVICSYAEDVLTIHAIYGDTNALKSLPNVQHFREDCATFLNKLAQKLIVDLDSSKQLIEYSKKKLGMGSAVRDLSEPDQSSNTIKRAAVLQIFAISPTAFDRAVKSARLQRQGRGIFLEAEILSLARQLCWERKP